MSLIRLLPIFICFSSLGQVNLIIKDATNSGFLLGINGYAQNSEPVKELVVRKLDTFPFTVRVEIAPRVFFQKKMHFHEKGNYSYVITTNSRDELQLRYRGSASSLPTSMLAVDLKTEGPLIASATPAKEEKPLENLETKQALKEEDPTPKVPAKVEEVAVKDSTPEVVVETKTPEVQPTPITEPEAEPVKNPFDTFFTKLQNTEFEYEKLSTAKNFGQEHMYSLEEIQKVLAVMKYDNTRLEFLKSIRDQLKKLKNKKDLMNSFDYEVSKIQYNDLIR